MTIVWLLLGTKKCNFVHVWLPPFAAICTEDKGVHKCSYDSDQGRAKLHFLVPKSNQTIINDMSFDQTKTISLESDKMQIDNIKQ